MSDWQRLADLLPSMEFCRRAGITFRQLDYYTRRGAISAAVPANGSGSRRLYSPALVPAVRTADAVSRGISPDRTSRPNHLLVKRIVDNYHQGGIALGNGIRIVWDVER